MKKGKFIVFYGINNLGKTTQAKLLVDRLNFIGEKAEYLKYAIYDLEPSGPLLNEYLRKDNPLEFTVREFQILQVLNRWQYQPKLIETLNKGISVVAEDYKETGLAWGIAGGVDGSFLEYLNSKLLNEDISFYLFGKPFITNVEKSHMHESNNDLTKKAEQTHLELAEKDKWIKINADRSIVEISDEIFTVVNLLYQS